MANIFPDPWLHLISKQLVYAESQAFLRVRTGQLVLPYRALQLIKYVTGRCRTNPPSAHDHHIIDDVKTCCTR